MEEREKFYGGEEKDLYFYKKTKNKKIQKLDSCAAGYSVDKFMSDFVKYFDEDIDFNLGKIRTFVEISGRLEELVIKAQEKNTHPVTEFVQELFKDLAS